MAFFAHHLLRKECNIGYCGRFLRLRLHYVSYAIFACPLRDLKHFCFLCFFGASLFGQLFRLLMSRCFYGALVAAVLLCVLEVSYAGWSLAIFLCHCLSVECFRDFISRTNADTSVSSAGHSLGAESELFTLRSGCKDCFLRSESHWVLLSSRYCLLGGPSFDLHLNVMRLARSLPPFKFWLLMDAC